MEAQDLRSIVLEYLYQNFGVIFILCLIGVFIRQSLDSLKTTKVSEDNDNTGSTPEKNPLFKIIRQVLAFAALAASIVSGLSEIFTIENVAIFALISIFGGLIIKDFVELFMQDGFIRRFIINLSKEFLGKTGKAFMDAATETEEIAKQDKTNEKK